MKGKMEGRSILGGGIFSSSEPESHKESRTYHQESSEHGKEDMQWPLLCVGRLMGTSCI